MACGADPDLLESMSHMSGTSGNNGGGHSRGLAIFFVAVFLFMIWPVYPLFSRIHPIFLGVPFSLIYLIVILAVSFLVLLGFYLWESRRGGVD